jgi:hypothetical protein
MLRLPAALAAAEAAGAHAAASARRTGAECRTAEVKDRRILCEIMEGAFQLDIPLGVECARAKTGKR